MNIIYNINNIYSFILDEVCKGKPELKAKLEGMDLTKRRYAMLALLLGKKENDVKVMVKNIRNGVVVDKMEAIDNIISKIRSYIPVSEEEKKINGEVFTPFELINEMLDTLPAEVWSDPTKKWLDAANGVGNFPAIVVKRLMVGLKEWESDDEKRYKHIMENMIYVCDISPKNMFIYLMLFDPDDKYKLNFHCGSFLEKEFDELGWGEMDIVVGNPPYQESGATGDNKLYLKFISLILKQYLTKEGLLLFVTPKKVIENFTSLKNREYMSKDFDFIKVSLDTPSLYFNQIGSSFCYFLLKNVYEQNEKTEIEYLDLNNNKHIIIDNIYNFKKLPTRLDNVTLSILNKTVFKKDKKFDFSVMIKENGKQLRIRKKQIEDGVVVSTKDNKFKYLLVDKLKAKGNTIYYFNEKLKGHNLKKVLISKGGSYTFPFYDRNGEYSASDNLLVKYVENDIEGENFVFLGNSKLVKFVEGVITKGNDMDFSWTLMNISEIDIKTNKISNESIYKCFNLDQEEINLIESTVGGVSKSVGCDINSEYRKFNSGDKFNFNGISKKVKKGVVEVIGQTAKKVRVKDSEGNEGLVDPKKLTEISK